MDFLSIIDRRVERIAVGTFLHATAQSDVSDQLQVSGRYLRGEFPLQTTVVGIPRMRGLSFPIHPGQKRRKFAGLADPENSVPSGQIHQSFFAPLSPIHPSPSRASFGKCEHHHPVCANQHLSCSRVTQSLSVPYAHTRRPLRLRTETQKKIRDILEGFFFAYVAQVASHLQHWTGLVLDCLGIEHSID